MWRSFSLLGNGVVLFSGAMLAPAREAFDAALDARVPPALRDAFLDQQRAFVEEAHDWLRAHNWSVDARMRGYAELTRALEGAYAWPVAAALALVHLRRSIAMIAVVGAAGRLAPIGAAGDVQQLLAATFDVLLRTNRMVCVDAALLMLLAKRCDALRREGRAELALALLEGPAPIVMDDESVALARGVYELLATRDERARFAASASLTRAHFLREQAIVSRELEDNRAFWTALPAAVRAVISPRWLKAPSIVAGARRERRLEWQWVALSGADFMDHPARIREFGGAFVESLLGSPEDLAAAARWVASELGAHPPR